MLDKYEIWGEHDPNRIDRHHLISQCQKDLFNVFLPKNIIKLKRKTHEAIHAVFTDEHWPIHEPQLQTKRFFEIIRPILWQQALKYFEKLISLPIQDFYSPELIKYGKYNKQRFWRSR